ncbi:hypothetical protein VIF_001169 [Vibrio cholerae TM 11079-80]|nr:hypothetical protein VIF_001169 [Vibrio cholerae TM 11079-80]
MPLIKIPPTGGIFVSGENEVYFVLVGTISHQYADVFGEIDKGKAVFFLVQKGC